MHQKKNFHEDEESLEIETDEELSPSPLVPELSGEKSDQEATKTPTQSIPPSRRLTNRQRALYSGHTETTQDSPSTEVFISEPASSPNKNTEKQNKRRILRQEKLELDKQATIDKLLLKQVKQPSLKKQKLDYEESVREKEKVLGGFQLQPNMVRMIDNKEYTVLLCTDVQIFEQFKSELKGSFQKCSYCSNKKVCSDSKSGILLCSSMSCYRKSQE